MWRKVCREQIIESPSDLANQLTLLVSYRLAHGFDLIELCSASGQLFWRQVRNTVKFFLPMIIVSPALRRRYGRARGFGALQQLQCQGQSCPLAGDISGFASGIAKGEVAKDEPRHAAVFDDVTGRAHDNCGNAISLEVSCGQTDRLVADGSVGDQNREVHLILPQQREQVGAVLVLGCGLAAIGRKAIVTG